MRIEDITVGMVLRRDLIRHRNEDETYLLLWVKEKTEDFVRGPVLAFEGDINFYEGIWNLNHNPVAKEGIEGFESTSISPDQFKALCFTIVTIPSLEDGILATPISLQAYRRLLEF